jgi:hypothetical protein
MNFFRVIYRFFIKNWYWIYLFAERIWKSLKDNAFYRWLITVGLKVFISGIDNFGLDKIGQTWKTDLIPIVDAAMEGRVHDVRGYVTDLLNKRIDIKFLDNNQELMLFDSLTKTIALAIDYYVQKNI